MIKEIFNHIKDALMLETSIADVKLWRKGVLESIDEISNFPLVYLEFTSIQYKNNTNKTQECNDGQFAAHILFKNIDDEDLSILDTSQEVYVALQQAGYTRISEGAEDTGGEVVDWKITFEMPRFIDEDAKKLKRPDQTIPKPPPHITQE